MWIARGRFLLYWISQVARVMADWALRITVFQLLLEERPSAWHLVTTIFILPSVVLAPFLGSISNSLPKRSVMVASSILCSLVAIFLVGAQDYWIVALTLTALGSALYGPTRFALQPAIAVDTRIALTRIVAWTEVGSTAAIVVGFMVGFWLYPPPTFQDLLLVICGLNVLSTALAVLCYFPSDVRRPELPLQSIRGFFTDCRRIKEDKLAWGSLLGLGAFQGLIAAGAGTVVTHALTGVNPAQEDAIRSLLFVCLGLAVGCALASLQPNIRRCLGIVFLGAIGLMFAQVWMSLSMSDEGLAPIFPVFLLGIMSGLINAPLRASYQAAVPADARGNAMAIMYALLYLVTSIIAGVMILLISIGWLPTPRAQMWFLTGLGAVGMVIVWQKLLSPTFELFAEIVMLPLYRIRSYGPGKDLIPAKGPVILVANHSAYVDPFWIGKVIPRKLTPMMTSKFFDMPIIRWLMVKVVKAIRVEATGFRREAPELQEAINELKRGGCVLLFPEAILRRKEDQILRKFGQGIWHILREVPETPVIVFWIEGGWGSYASYKGGPPFKNKKLDFRRPIDIAVSEPEIIDPTILESHRALRNYLMERCLQARGYLGLEVPDLESVLHTGGEDESASESEHPAPTPR